MSSLDKRSTGDDITQQLIEELAQLFFQRHLGQPLQLTAGLLAKKSNYSIWRLESGHYEIRVFYSDNPHVYHRASTKGSLQAARAYVQEQVSYHGRRAKAEVMVEDYGTAR